MSDAPSDRGSKGCGILEGFNQDDAVALVLERRPEQRGEWLVPGQPPAYGQRVKVQVITAATWGILTGRVIEVGDGFVIARAHRTTDDETLPSGPYLLTLHYDGKMKCPWVLTHAEFADED